jgi:hypothetical protein
MGQKHYQDVVSDRIYSASLEYVVAEPSRLSLQELRRSVYNHIYCKSRHTSQGDRGEIGEPKRPTRLTT